MMYKRCQALLLLELHFSELIGLGDDNPNLGFGV